MHCSCLHIGAAYHNLILATIVFILTAYEPVCIPIVILSTVSHFIRIKYAAYQKNKKTNANEAKLMNIVLFYLNYTIC